MRSHFYLCGMCFAFAQFEQILKGLVMIDFVRLAADRMEARIRRQEVYANNVANVGTAGYKRDRVFQKVLNEAGRGTSYNMWEVPDFSQGPLRETTDPFNVAITGSGFFVIDNEDGQRYTRNGSFMLNENGELVLESAGPVMGENGPIEVKGKMEISIDGNVFVNGTLVDRLKIVDFEDKENALRKVGHSMYELADDKAEEIEASGYRIDQGFIEESNVNAVEEMVNMLSIMRYFEATQKTMQTLDNVLDRAANQIGRVS